MSLLSSNPFASPTDQLLRNQVSSSPDTIHVWQQVLTKAGPSPHMEAVRFWGLLLHEMLTLHPGAAYAEHPNRLCWSDSWRETPSIQAIVA